MAAPTSPDPVQQEWPGQRLGLPEVGSGAVAGWGRRLLALLIDWILSTLVASAFTGQSAASPPEGADRWLPLLIFCFEATVLTMTWGGSSGQLVMRIAVYRVGGGLLDPIRALVRSILICLVIPPIIYNRDQRGLHDLATGSIAVRR